MLSICIPVYNFNISVLIEALTEQVMLLAMPCEIICIDDASDTIYRTVNTQAAKNIVYIQLPANVGRARIRNLFLNYTRYNNLLFLDCDSLIISPTFLSHYIQYIKQNNNYSVVCGGRVYNITAPERKYKLRWLYGINKESIAANKRNLHPNASFMTNNFLIRKHILQSIKFDERITEYGHEDTLFGYALQRSSITITHINNPVLNGHLETNEEYLRKTENAVSNLVSILSYVNNDKVFINTISLLRFYSKVKGVRGFIRFLFFITQPALRRLLSGRYVNLLLFDFYKLGLLAKYINKTNS